MGGSMSSGMKLVGAWSILVLILSTPLTGRGLEAAEQRVQTIPLGGALSDQEGGRYYGVYVPTRFGGNLTITTSSGSIEDLKGPDGKARQNGEDVGFNAQGWYLFQVKDAKEKYKVSVKFVQQGQAARMPWSFYYWPTKSDAIHEPWSGGNGRVDTYSVQGDDLQVATPGGYIEPGQDIVRAGPNGILETPVARGDDSTWFPNLYDDTTFRGADGSWYQTPSPMLKYDQLFSTFARSYEASNSQNQDIQRWPGHCLGAAIASISLNEPVPAPGSGLTKDELKALWAELGENHMNHRIGEYVKDIPPGPPRPGYDGTDSFAPKFHSLLETFIKSQKKSLLGNLRAFPPRGTVVEVWNHGIGKYTSEFEAVPNLGDRAVRIKTELVANAGSSLNGNDDKPRIVKYEYIIVYGIDGNVDPYSNAMADWISVGGEAMFTPLNLMEVAESRWQGHNPYISEANVRSVDLANGGAGGRFALAGTAPQFRPVAQYELGRSPNYSGGAINSGFASFNNNANANPSSLPNATPRRGLMSRMFSR